MCLQRNFESRFGRVFGLLSKFCFLDCFRLGFKEAVMPKLILFVLFLLIRSVSASDLYPHLTPEDERRINRLPEEKRELVRDVADYIRGESQRLGVDPAEAFGDGPNGIDDREYRRRRLEALQAKRERKAEEVRQMHERQARRLQETGRKEETMTAEEAGRMMSGFVPVPTKKVKELRAGGETNYRTEEGSDDAVMFFEDVIPDEDTSEVFAGSGVDEDELRYPGNIDLRKLFEEEKHRRRMHEADDAWMPKKPSERLTDQSISLRADKHRWSDIASNQSTAGVVRVSFEEAVPDQGFAERLRQLEKSAETKANSESMLLLKHQAEKGAERYSENTAQTVLTGGARKDLYETDKVKSDRRFVIFISESMGVERLRNLFRAYAGDGSVHFVLRGFRGYGTLNEGLKNILELARDIEPVPNIEINPELFRTYRIDRVPAMLVESVENRETEDDFLRDQVTGDLYSIYAETFGVSAAERIKAMSAPKKKRYRSELLVFGVASREWAERRIEEGADFDQGTRGAVYEITEPDLEEVMKQRALAVDWNAKKEAAVKRYWTTASKHYVKLPGAARDEVRTVDPSFVAPQTLYDAAGVVIVEKGTRLNPLDHIPFTQELIVFNATDASQLAVVDALVSEASKKTRPVKLITTEIDSEKGWEQFNALVSRWNTPLYLLTPELKERFGLKAVPVSVTASEEAGKLLVREFAVSPDQDGS